MEKQTRKKQRPKKKVIVLSSICVLVLVGGLALWFNRSSSRIPDSLIEFKTKYPEAAAFVDNYPKNKDKKWDIDLSGEVQPEHIPLFLQWDERWGYETYGSDLLALTGCGPTCISMVVCGLNQSTYWNPYETAKFSEQQGYYVPGEGTSWNLMTEGAGLLGLNAAYGEVSSDYIYSYLDPCHPIICSMYPGDFTYTGHFIVLTGIDADGNIIVNDPNSRINSEKHWSMETLLPQIRNLWSYSI
ncbi:MAG: papain-like cysteine protease family protein [Lachnospiraceae bacterium]|nr:papain-like cysteine protease family protein [Lachnospiraceae bacterium]